MIYKLTLLFLTTIIILQAKAQDIKKLRELFYNASQNSRDANAFYNYMKDVSIDESATAGGYKAMSEFMKCYHSYNPITKLTFYDKGKTHLDHVIETDSSNVELRYLRFSVQLSIPSFLDYKQNIETDKKFLVENLELIAEDKMLYEMIRSFLLESNYCSDDEKQKIRLPFLRCNFSLGTSNNHIKNLG
jgi:hypothetical protein